jgi:class 3 adenylate cyclase
MECPSCGADNSPGHKHCLACGTRLERPCPGCNSINPANHRFCSECGDSLLSGVRAKPAQRPRAEERRFVTALFADLVGFTPLTESADAEDVRHLLTRYFDKGRTLIEGFGGVVDKFIGDAITAFWGAEISHEDDAERAVRAALGLVDAVAALGAEVGHPGLAARVGILSGETAVGPGGNQHGLIIGDIVNTAARLQTVAEPGTVIVGDSTKSLTEGSIEYASLESKVLKGKASPVPVWRAIGPLSVHGGRRRTRGREAPFVGRLEELRILMDQLSVVGRERRPRLTSIVGEGGIGKSRLVGELEAYAGGLADGVQWLQGRSPAYGDGVTFWALGEMIRQLAGVAETADTGTSLARLHATLSEYVLNPEDRRWIEPRLEGLLGLGPFPQGDREELYGALRMFFQRITEHGPTVLVFEDLHWGDPGLVEFVEQLVERSPRHPLLVIVLARPALLERHPGWGAGKPNRLSIHLGPLAEADIAELVRALAPALTDAEVERIAEASAGVPLYAVELVRTWIAAGLRDRSSAGGGGLSIPDSLQSVIGARLDLLEPADRALLQQASILGQTFTVDALAVLASDDAGDVNASLAGLVRAEVLAFEDDPTSPERGQYRFVQELIREVAYGRMTRTDRRAKHIAAALYLQALDDPELAPVVAAHYLKAYEADPGHSQELADQGIQALMSAADRAANLHSHSQAVNLYRQAAGLTDDPARIGAILEQALESARATGQHDVVTATAAQAFDGYRRAGDVQGTSRITTVEAESLCDEFRAQEAMDRLATIPEDRLEGPTRVKFLAAKSRASFMTDRPHEAIKLADQIMADLEAGGDREALIHQIITKGSALWVVSRDTEGRMLLEGALRRAEEWRLGWAAGRARNNLLSFLQHDDPVGAGSLAEEGFAAARRLGDNVGMGRLLTWVVWDRIEHGRLGDAEALMAEVDESVFWSTDALDLTIARLTIGMLQGDERAAEERVRLARELLSDPNPSVRDTGRVRAAGALRILGRLAEAYNLLIGGETEESRQWGIPDAATMALWMGDGDRLRFLRDQHPLADRKERRFVGYRLLLEAGDLALAGKGIQAGRVFRELIDLWDGTMLPRDVNELRALYAAMVPDDQASAEAAEAALRWIEVSGARGLLAVWRLGARSEPSQVPA